LALRLVNADPPKTMVPDQKRRISLLGRDVFGQPFFRRSCRARVNDFYDATYAFKQLSDAGAKIKTAIYSALTRSYC
jgi:hypothetical protein